MIWRLTPVRLIPEVKLKGDVTANRGAKAGELTTNLTTSGARRVILI